MLQARKLEEREYLKTFVSQLPKEVVPKVVAHRGFHNSNDDLSRPLENTLEAFQEAWRSGINLVECDITVSSDGVIVFGHDKTFERLAKPLEEIHLKRLEKQPLKELERLRLRDNSSVLLMPRVAEELAKEKGAQLVVEVKSSAPAEIVVQSLMHHFSTSNLTKSIPLVMSFKPSTVFLLKQTLDTSSLETKPKVMLLIEREKTSNKSTQYTYEEGTSYSLPVELDMDTEEFLQVVLERFLRRGETLLDGLYLQFDHRMLQPDSQVRKNIAALCRRCIVGVFLGGADRSNDKYDTVDSLVEVGVSFVNTDVPKGSFF